MQIVPFGDNLHEMSKPVFWGKYEKYFSMSSAENFTQSAMGLWVFDMIGVSLLKKYIVMKFCTACCYLSTKICCYCLKLIKVELLLLNRSFLTFHSHI